MQFISFIYFSGISSGVLADNRIKIAHHIVSLGFMYMVYEAKM